MQKKKRETLTILAPEIPPRRQWWQNKWLWLSVAFSCAWVILLGHYLLITGWWESRFDLTLTQFVGDLGGMAMPMVIFWLICAYCDRTNQLESEAETLKSYLNELVYPTEEGAIYTRTLTDALRTQIKEFRSIYTGVTEHTNKVQENLQRWIE